MRGQLQQVFTFILIAIVIVTTLYIGLKLFGGVVDEKCSAEEARLVSQLKESFAAYDTTGTRMTVELGSVCDANALCFLNPGVTAEEVSSFTDPVDSGIISEAAHQQLVALASLEDKNIFLIDQETVIDLHTEPRLRTGTIPYLCVKRAGNSFLVRFIGKGKIVRLEGG